MVQVKISVPRLFCSPRVPGNWGLQAGKVPLSPLPSLKPVWTVVPSASGSYAHTLSLSSIKNHVICCEQFLYAVIKE